MLEFLKKPDVWKKVALFSFLYADSSTSFIVYVFATVGVEAEAGGVFSCGSCCAMGENADMFEDADDDTSFTGRVLVGVIRLEDTCATETGTGLTVSDGLTPRDRKLEDASMMRCIRKERARPTFSGTGMSSAVDSAIRFLASFISTLARLRRITINTTTVAIINIVRIPDNITTYNKHFQNSCIWYSTRPFF